MTTERQPSTTFKLPRLLIALINVVIAFHLFALGTMVLAASTGPWSVRFLETPSEGLGPPFATSIAQYTAPYYLQPLGLANNYHFESNVTDLPSIYLEILSQAKNQADKLPDPRANWWVRQRQQLLVSVTGRDYPFRPRPGEGVAAQGQNIESISFFCQPHEAVMLKLEGIKDFDYPSEECFVAAMVRHLTREEFDRYKEEILNMVKGPQADGHFKLTDKLIHSVRDLDGNNKVAYLYQEQEHRLPKMPQMLRPGESSLIVVQSIARYLEQQRGEPVEVVRVFRQPIVPALMFPNLEAPGKLLIDTPMYNLESTYHNFGNGHPRNWSPK